VDTINKLKVTVHTVVSGYVASAGTLLSIVGKKRFITSNSFMMIHELRSSFWGKYSDARDQISNLDKLMTTITNIIKNKSKITEDELKDVLIRDRNWSTLALYYVLG
jgi:ATP-dependent protease ClpP protease subunit